MNFLNKNKCVLIHLIFVLLTNSSMSQSNTNKIGVFHFNKKLNQLVNFYKDSVMFFNPIGENAYKKKNISIPKGHDFNSYEIIYNNEYFFIEKLGGTVYSIKNDSLKRLDKSYTHKMTLGSNVFAYNDTIFRFGGYGYWTSNNILSYYDSKTNEWELVDSKNGNKSSGRFSGFHKIIDDELYVFGGKKVDKKNHRKFTPNSEVWKFNFKNKVWDFLGNSNIDISKDKLNFDYNNLLYVKSENTLQEIDITNNTTKTYKLTTLINQHRNNYSPIQYKDSLFFVAKESGKEKFIAVSFNDLVSTQINSSSFYGSIKLYKLSGLILLLILLLVIGFKVYLKERIVKTKIVSKNDNFYFGRSLIILNEDEKKILKRLISNNFKLENEEVLRIFENTLLDRSQNIRNKNRLVSDLNTKLKAYLKISEDILKFQKSSKDNRMKILAINPYYFHIK